jgi:predicted outer membrane repeat protein
VDAHANPGADTIVFDGVSTVTLTSGALTISSDLTIEGGIGVTIARSLDVGTAKFRIFEITGSDIEVTLDTLTIMNGSAANGDGGGIFIGRSSVTVQDSTFKDNLANESGGGIFYTAGASSSSSLTVSNSTFINNTAQNYDGGAIANRGPLTVTESTFTNNYAYEGGGIATEHGSAEIVDSTFNANTVFFAGGGIYHRGKLTITDSFFSENTATDGAGGGIYHPEGDLTLISSTFEANVAPSGGGISTGDSIVTIRDSTFKDNLANESGGGIFYTAGASSSSSLTVSNSTFINNTADNYDGGAIANRGPLTVTESTFTNNYAYEGGGVSSQSQNAEITNSTFDSNVAMFAGGGLHNTSVLTVSTNIFTGNVARVGGGGGIYSSGNNLVLTASTLADNTALYGGGIANDGTLTMFASTVNANTADGRFGGGMWNSSGATVVNSTFSGNTATLGGGGISNDSTLVVTNSTLSENRADDNGGGIFNRITSAQMLINNTIVANNTSGDITNQGTLDATGANIVETAVSGSGTIDGGENIRNVDPQLRPLADNGGLTRTHLPQNSSPAIDAGTNAVVQPLDEGMVTTDQPALSTTIIIRPPLEPYDGVLTTDQRGFPRNVDSSIDIGSVEVLTVPVAINVRRGAPGSVFVVCGARLEPNTTYKVLINEVPVGEVTTDATGILGFVIVTDEEAAAGLYNVTLHAPLAVAQAGFGTQYVLDPNAPVRDIPQTVTASIMSVPETIKALNQRYLPFIATAR